VDKIFGVAMFELCLCFFFFNFFLLHLDNVILVSPLGMTYVILYLNNAILIIVIVEQFL
jgi:hypothetical protein